MTLQCKLHASEEHTTTRIVLLGIVAKVRGIIRSWRFFISDVFTAESENRLAIAEVEIEVIGKVDRAPLINTRVEPLCRR